MRNLALIILLSAISGSSLAGWVKVLYDDNYNNRSPCDKDCYFIYVDFATITKAGDTVKVWRMKAKCAHPLEKVKRADSPSEGRVTFNQ